jgi:hypothetical protein
MEPTRVFDRHSEALSLSPPRYPSPRSYECRRDLNSGIAVNLSNPP